jgi:hypothetical protein
VVTTNERVQRHILATSRERGARRARRARTRRSVLALEPLEDRTILSTVRWINPAGGDRDTASNSDGGTVPGPGDVVVIEVAGAPTIAHNPGKRVDRHAPYLGRNRIVLVSNVLLFRSCFGPSGLSRGRSLLTLSKNPALSSVDSDG